MPKQEAKLQSQEASPERLKSPNERLKELESDIRIKEKRVDAYKTRIATAEASGDSALVAKYENYKSQAEAAFAKLKEEVAEIKRELALSSPGVETAASLIAENLDSMAETMAEAEAESASALVARESEEEFARLKEEDAARLASEQSRVAGPKTEAEKLIESDSAETAEDIAKRASAGLNLETPLSEFGGTLPEDFGSLPDSTQETIIDAKKELGTVRQAYAAAQAEVLKKFGSPLGWVRRMTNRENYIAANKTLKAAELAYQEKRAEQVSAVASEYIQEQLALVEATSTEVSARKDLFDKFKDKWKKMGKLRTAVGIGLLVGGVATGSASVMAGAMGVRALMGAVGGSMVSYDLMKKGAGMLEKTVKLSPENQKELDDFAKREGLSWISTKVSAKSKEKLEAKKLELQAREAPKVSMQDLDIMIKCFEAKVIMEGNPKMDETYLMLMNEKKRRLEMAVTGSPDQEYAVAQEKPKLIDSEIGRVVKYIGLMKQIQAGNAGRMSNIKQARELLGSLTPASQVIIEKYNDASQKPEEMAAMLDELNDELARDEQLFRTAQRAAEVSAAKFERIVGVQLEQLQETASVAGDYLKKMAEQADRERSAAFNSETKKRVGLAAVSAIAGALIGAGIVGRAMSAAENFQATAAGVKGLTELASDPEKLSAFIASKQAELLKNVAKIKSIGVAGLAKAKEFIATGVESPKPLSSVDFSDAEAGEIMGKAPKVAEVNFGEEDVEPIVSARPKVSEVNFGEEDATVIAAGKKATRVAIPKIVPKDLVPGMDNNEARAFSGAEQSQAAVAKAVRKIRRLVPEIKTEEIADVSPNIDERAFVGVSGDKGGVDLPAERDMASAKPEIATKIEVPDDMRKKPSLGRLRKVAGPRVGITADLNEVPRRVLEADIAAQTDAMEYGPNAQEGLGKLGAFDVENPPTVAGESAGLPVDENIRPEGGITANLGESEIGDTVPVLPEQFLRTGLFSDKLLELSNEDFIAVNPQLEKLSSLNRTLDYARSVGNNEEIERLSSAMGRIKTALMATEHGPDILK